MSIRGLAKDTVVVSFLYFVANLITFQLWMPVQNFWFPEVTSWASLLFLPHGVRVLSGWLLGWRSIVALAPGVFCAFASLAGMGVFTPSRMAAILVAITVPAAIFYLAKVLNFNVSPQAGRRPCWPCVMAAGVVISIVTSLLTNYALGSPPGHYVAYLIGDVFGLFFLMLLLMFAFRAMRLS